KRGAGLSRTGAELLGEGVVDLTGSRRRAPAVAAPRPLRRQERDRLGLREAPGGHGVYFVLAAAGGPALRQCHCRAARGALPQEQSTASESVSAESKPPVLRWVGWGTDQGIGGFGEEPGIKSQLTNLIRSVRTVMRVPLIIVNSVAIVLLLLFG
uniref:Immediate early response 3-interacting protein 1 n=1 Tax=Equus caballus TaxID=9796 RepID=F6R9B2_HORSE